jgi:acetyltransferase-like isoleucine patch superfamily enzyme
VQYKIHKLSDVQTKDIGVNTNIWQFCVIFKAANIGDNCNICSHCLIEGNVKIGNNVTIKSGVQVWDGLTIEDNVFIGPNVTFTNDIYPRSKNPVWKEVKTNIKRNASIGANATILGGIEIGEYSMVGAGSVVTKSLPPYTVWYGNPAKHKGYITKDGIVLSLNFIDLKTGDKYELHNNTIMKLG